jgi:hypothetical protein
LLGIAGANAMRGRPAQPWFYAAKNTWYVWNGDRKMSPGVRGEDNQAEAMKAWHRLMANGRATAEAKADVPTVAELVKDFLAHAEAPLRPATVRGYRDFFGPFAKAHGNRRADRLTPAVADTYARKPQWSNSTRHDFLSVLSIAFKWANYPLIGLKKPPMESRGDKSLIGNEAHVVEFLGHSSTVMLRRHYAHLNAKAKAPRLALAQIR